MPRSEAHVDRRLSILSVALTIAMLPLAAHAQSILDRTVGKDGDRNLVITQLTGPAVGALAAAAGVPAGIEIASVTSTRITPVMATGRTVREVADALTAADPRYAWREDDGVLVLRPIATWSGSIPSLLDQPVGAMEPQGIDVSHRLSLIAAVFGVAGQREGGGDSPDTRRVSVDVPAGGTRLDALNAIVRAHGRLAWALEPARDGSANVFPFSVWIFNGPAGAAFGIPRRAGSRTLAATDTRARTPAPADPKLPLLDRIVGAAANDQPFVVFGTSSVPLLAAAVGVPMGVQKLAPGLPRVIDPTFAGYPVTGMTLGAALDVIQGLDRRYAWREMDGVIVFRPVTAWDDPTDPLFRPVAGVQFDRVPTSQALEVVVERLGGYPSTQVVETRPVSVDVPPGSILELLNGVARAHGELTWEWWELTPHEQHASGRRHLLNWHRSGRSVGWSLP